MRLEKSKLSFCKSQSEKHDKELLPLLVTYISRGKLKIIVNFMVRLLYHKGKVFMECYVNQVCYASEKCYSEYRSSVKQGWERKWVVLSDMKLSIYENENTEGKIIPLFCL